jgi:hypothetical protein
MKEKLVKFIKIQKKKYIFYFCAVLLLLGISGSIFLSRFPAFAKQSILETVATSCPSCKLEIADLSISYFPSAITMRAVNFMQGNPELTEIEFTIPEITIEIDLSQILFKKILVNKITIKNPKVKISEGDKKNPKSEEKDAANSWQVLVKAIQIESANFIFENIHVAIDELGNIGAQKEKITNAEAKGILANDGHFELKVSSLLFASPLYVDILLTLHQLSLSEVNSYFEPSEGIQLKGTLESGESKIIVRDKEISGFVRARYTDFNLHFKKTKERSWLVTLFDNIGKGFKIHSSDLKDEAKNQERNCSVQKNAEHTLLHFIFHCMGEAATKLVQQ